MKHCRAAEIFVLLVMLSTFSSAAAAERASDEVLQLCRAGLASKKDAIVVDIWSTNPLPHEYRQVAAPVLRHDTVSGWITHKNPNGTLTVVIHAFDPETEEGYFVILAKDETVLFKNDVFAFEFALSSGERKGVNGLFFCSKTGPSNEWVWDGNNWKITK